MKVFVIGCGRWGSLITWYLDSIGHDVTLYGRRGSKNMERFLAERRNDLLSLPESVGLTTSIEDIKDSETVIISIASQALRGLLGELAALKVENKNFVLCMKGIEIGSCKRLSEIAEELLLPSNTVSVWLGPGHVQEFYAGIPNCMVIDGKSEVVKRRLVDEFSSELIRFYYGTDLIGNEIGGASKNVIGIAAGMLDGFGLSTLKGALMSRGTREIGRLIAALGGNEISAYGLCHLGDYEATVFSKYSHNRQFGESVIKGESFDQLAEGYYTVKALIELSEKHGVELPICRAVYDVLYENKPPYETLSGLFARRLKSEF